tara:strand:- start:386 stop:874 length:489 start_codon:yes stop_codon:yes gene_type:complete
MIKILKSIYILMTIYVLFIAMWYMPFSYSIKNSNVNISLDLFFFYLLVQSFIIDRFKLIVLGFLIGFFIDIDNEISLIGVNSFLMPISCYFLGFVRLNSSNWETHKKLIYIIFVLIISYSIKGFFYQWAIVPNIVPFIVNSMLIILAFLSVNQFYYKKKLMA